MISPRKPRNLTVKQFHRLVAELAEPFRTMSQVAVCFGLRVSELLGLRWSDVDWLNSKLRIERAIVMQNVDAVKTEESRREMTIAKELLDILTATRPTSRKRPLLRFWSRRKSCLRIGPSPESSALQCTTLVGA